MYWGLVLVGVLVGMGTIQAEEQPAITLAQAAPDEGMGARYLRVCTAELKLRNLPAGASDCEKVLERSRLIQSDAIRYLAQANDAAREAFGGMSTMGRFETVVPDADLAILVPLLLDEAESATPRMVVQLAGDVMKPGCGYYQIDILMKALENADALPQPPKQQARKPVVLEYKSCIGGALPDGKVVTCLNPIFQPTISAPSPSP